MKNKTYSTYTLGCKLNFSETSAIDKFFTDAGYIFTVFPGNAEVYLINTCSVTANANKKSRNAISRAVKANPEACIIVTGCYAQLNTDELKEIAGIDYIIGINNKDEIKNILINHKKKVGTEIIATNYKSIKDFFPAASKGKRTRAFLKIQDGCDYFCSYCTIPLARGKSRNQSIAETVTQVKEIAETNTKEIVLTGVNIGDFGKSTGESFYQLLKELTKTQNIQRFRIGSVEPELLSDEIIYLIAEKNNIMPHFHIPLQSGSNEMLRLMNRKYDTEFFFSKVDLINKIIPNAHIGIDIIVGVNGETEKMFLDSLDFFNRINISSAHIFMYSERKNTKALSFEPKLSVIKKQERVKVMKNMADTKHVKWLKNQIGLQTTLLIESSKILIHKGFTENYIETEIISKKQLANKIVNIEVSGFSGNEKRMIGTILE